jgi:hypothetical protein
MWAAESWTGAFELFDHATPPCVARGPRGLTDTAQTEESNSYTTPADLPPAHRCEAVK